MTPTDKILAEFDKKFGRAGSSGSFKGIRDDGIKAFISDKILEEFDKKWDNYEFSFNSSDHYDGANKDKIKAFISAKINQQAITKERARVRAVIKNICNNYVEEVSGCEDVEIVRDKILSSLDKLTDK